MLALSAERFEEIRKSRNPFSLAFNFVPYRMKNTCRGVKRVSGAQLKRSKTLSPLSPSPVSRNLLL